LGQLIVEAAGKKRDGQMVHVTVATCSEQFVCSEQHMPTVMDGATELWVGLRALTLVLHIVLTAIPAALIVTTGKSHNGPS